MEAVGVERFEEALERSDGSIEAHETGVDLESAVIALQGLRVLVQLGVGVSHKNIGLVVVAVEPDRVAAVLECGSVVRVESREDGPLIKRFGELGVFHEDTVEKEHGLIVVAVIHEFDRATEEKVLLSGAGSVSNGREGV